MMISRTGDLVCLIFLSFLWLSDFLTGYRYEDCIDLFQVVYKLFVLYTLHDMLIIDYSGEGVRTSFLHQYKYMYFYTVVCSLVPSICISMYIRIIHRLFRSAATSITGYYWRSKQINTTYVY